MIMKLQVFVMFMDEKYNVILSNILLLFIKISLLTTL